MDQSFIEKLFEEHQNTPPIPSPTQVCHVLNGLLGVLFPDMATQDFRTVQELEDQLEIIKIELHDVLTSFECQLEQTPEAIEAAFFAKIGEIRAELIEDAQAMADGDPAAQSKMEVIRTYPGFYAMAVFRLAHAFYELDVPLIPRILTEHAHGKTGIDIHPGATIGKRFCIDHGTGIVIGETLGALSVKKEMAESKRHPTIEDNVVIYAGATILGGDTVIGRDSIIGGSVWITKSIEPFSRIYYRAMGQRQMVTNFL